MTTTQGPPAIPGHRFVELIDEGGFAQVFKYVRESLGKEVAIKVLRPPVAGGLNTQDFQTEAIIMAKLSGHPNIVTIHDHGTADGGRPYLVMEYCPPPNLKARSERERLPLTFVLEVGILIAGALETAHRTGVFHRDIKPANVLMDGYGPKLTDFGISELLNSAGRELDAVSIPWAPLEAIEGTGFDRRSDIYSLAATLYTLLTGRWPHQVVGGSNDWHELLIRMRTTPPQPIGRPDVPHAVEQFLRSAMHPDRNQRPHDALSFAAGLRNLAPPGWNPPVALVPEETTAAVREVTQDIGGWPVHQPPVWGRPVVPSPSPSASLELTTGVSGDRTVKRGSPPAAMVPGGDPDDTRVRIPVPEPEPRSRRAALIGGALCAALGVAAAGLFLSGHDTKDPGTGIAETTSASQVLIDRPPVPQVTGWTDSGSNLTVTWQAPDAEPGDAYQWQLENSSRRVQPAGQETFAVVPGKSLKDHVCVEIWAVRGSTSSKATQSCSDDPA